MGKGGLRVNTPHVIHETIDGEVIVINLASGNYYSMRGAGADVWEIVQAQPGTDASGIVAAVSQRFDAPTETVEREVAAFLEELRREELIAATEDGAAAATAVLDGLPDADGRRPFEPPQLEKYTDLQDLVLLDPVHEVDATGWPHPKPDVAQA
ncbi:MAG TPA: PqqD family protein [Gaiellaceae bacterium]|nr:PqqD family protein [Gaiellaceae bacterium]